MHIQWIRHAAVLLVMTFAANRPTMAAEYDVAAFFWPAYHPSERWNEIAGWKENIGEWEIVKNCKPRFDGHEQPNVPKWGYEDESDPRVMEKKIDAAADHGVNVFIFDWYWYDNKPFQEDALNHGFLKAKNNERMKFYLMWANHDAGSLWNIEKSHLPNKVVWPGKVDRPTFDTIVDRVIERYMKHPTYYKIDGKPVFSIYELGTLIKGLGGVEQTKAALDSFREKVKAAGFPGLHVQAILWSNIPTSAALVPGDRSNTQANTLEVLGFDSLTNYQWVHYVHAKGNFRDWGKQAITKWPLWAEDFKVPFFPHVSIGWDTNPRFKNFQQNTIVNRSPKAFAEFLRHAKSHVDAHKLQPRLITINSWNEWCEGSYLEPDERYGMGFLEAVKTVFIDEVEADRRAASAPAPEVVIVKAVYGDLPKGASVDVTDKVRAFVSDGKRSIKASNDIFGDPAPSRLKELHVEYTRNGKTATTQAFEGGNVAFR